MSLLSATMRVLVTKFFVPQGQRLLLLRILLLSSRIQVPFKREVAYVEVEICRMQSNVGRDIMAFTVKSLLLVHNLGVDLNVSEV